MLLDEVASENQTQTTPWVTESDPEMPSLSAIVSLSLGTLLGVGYGVFEGVDSWTSAVGATFGVILVVFGLGLLLFGGKEVVTVDCASREIRVETVGGGLGRKTIVGFDEVLGVALSETLAVDEDAGRFFVQVHLRNGKSVNLFLGHYVGAFSRMEMQRRCLRLRGCIKAGSRQI